MRDEDLRIVRTGQFDDDASDGVLHPGPFPCVAGCAGEPGGHEDVTITRQVPVTRAGTVRLPACPYDGDPPRPAS